MLHAAPGVASARALTDENWTTLLRPWLGSGAERLAVPLPAVIAVRLAAPTRHWTRWRQRLDDGRAGHAGGKPRGVDPPALRTGAQPAGLRAGWRCCWWPRSPRR